MDDTTQRAAFPFGDTDLILTRPTDSQIFALALSRAGSDAETGRTVRRVLRVLEKLAGPEAWEGVVEEALIEGTVHPEELMRVAEELVKFPWDAPVPGTATDPGVLLVDPAPAAPQRDRAPRRV